MSKQQKKTVGKLESGSYFPSKASQYKNFKKWEKDNPDFFDKLPYHSDQVVYASESKEFFYESTKSVVPEGELIGIDVDDGDNVKLVLFKGIYWSPQE